MIQALSMQMSSHERQIMLNEHNVRSNLHSLGLPYYLPFMIGDPKNECTLYVCNLITYRPGFEKNTAEFLLHNITNLSQTLIFRNYKELIMLLTKN